MTVLAVATASRRPHDPAHHHPLVQRKASGGWGWVCSCGSSTCRSNLRAASWREALIGALDHSTHLAS